MDHCGDDNEMNASSITDLDSDDKSRRFAAIVAVGRLPRAQAEIVVDRLLKLASDTTDRQESALIVQVLGKVGDERTRPFLEKVLLSNLETKTGSLAAQGLGAIGSSRSVPVLDQARNAPSHIVRSAATQALKRISQGTKPRTC